MSKLAFQMPDMSDTPHFPPAILDKLTALQAKYAATGQDLASYLDGLLHADYLTYWDYIHLDTLLSLQTPRTPIPDESIFIMYHQITELYFKLSLHELEQLAAMAAPDADVMLKRVSRVNRYFEALTHSFDIMVDGMDPAQFLQFRTALLPASGFQSAQYRMIEIRCTTFDRLLHAQHRDRGAELRREDIPSLFSEMYWKAGAVELSSGEKTLTLKQFEAKYDGILLDLAHRCYETNVRRSYLALPESAVTDSLREQLKWLDVNVNIHWPLSHYKSAVRYLQKDPVDIAATGGTNWQKYLPPRFQKRIFFPELWSEQEMAEWGKGWVDRNVFKRG
ncbi:MAG: Tryptophan 2,3-dioxygenase [Bacteroidota bacterium]